MNKLHWICGPLLMLSFAPGCATTTFKEHDKKYADISLEQLLDAKKLPSAQKESLRASFIKRAEIDELNGRHNSAAKHARMALELFPDDTEAQLWLAYSHLGLGQLQKANIAFKRLSSSAPSALVFQGLGLTLLAQGGCLGPKYVEVVERAGRYL
jgi:tetratricopeptide (TPR) repeat protein